MASQKLYSVYQRCPVPVQNAACSAAGLRLRKERYGKVFWQVRNFLEISDWWSREQQAAYQRAQMRRVLNHAYMTVPYYREVFDALGLRPEDIRNLEDVANLPLLSKEVVRERHQDLLSRAVPESKRQAGRTGGTTGKALRLWWDRSTQPWQWAVWWRHRSRFGLEVGDRSINFAGRPVVPLARLEPPIWRHNLPLHQTYISVHHLTEGNLPHVVRYLSQRRVRFYSGYPSGLALVAKHILERGIELRHPPSVISTGAETVSEEQRALIETAFTAPVADQYGASEQCGNISQCEFGTYHIDTEFGLVELLPLVEGESDQYRIVCTGFRNSAMPLIRYDIGDIATIGSQCDCGRESPTVLRIDGRIESYIRTPDGRMLGRLDFLFKETDSIREAQIVQQTLHDVEILFVPYPSFCANDAESLLAKTRQYLGDQVSIKLVRVSSIPREANGKLRQIVTKIGS